MGQSQKLNHYGPLFMKPKFAMQGAFGTWHMLPSASMVDSVTGLRYAGVPVPPITLHY